MELRRITRLGDGTRSFRRAPVRLGAPGCLPAGGCARWTGGGQAGLGLTESLVALALLSTVVLALASGMLALLSTSRSNAQTQRLEAAVTAWTEAAKVLPYVRCASGYDLARQDPAWVAPTVGTARVTQVQHWRRSSSSFAAPVTPCTDDGGAQLLTLRVCLAQQATTAQIVIREPWPPPTTTSTTTTSSTSTTITTSTTVPTSSTSTSTSTTVPSTTVPCP